MSVDNAIFANRPLSALPKQPYTVIDLFSGCGGISWGFHSLEGYYVIRGAVDYQVAKPSARYDENGNEREHRRGTECNSTYFENIGVQPLNADMARLDPKSYRISLGLERGELSVLISCAPCTGFSQKQAANHMKDDPRNHLVQRSGLFVREFLPAVFVMENVKEMLLGKHRHHFEELRNILVDLGYSLRADVHNLADYGLPQRRIRSLIIARRDGGPIPPLPRPARREQQVRTVREAIGHLPPIRQGETHPDDPMHTCAAHTDEVTERMRAIPRDGGSWTDIIRTHPHLLTPSMKRKVRSNDLGSFPDVYGRMAWDRPAPTITRECGSPGNGRYTHPEQDRMLSVREMALLQGFPSNYTFAGGLTQRYNQIGDAVPPLISRQIAIHVLGLLTGGDCEFQRSTAIQEPLLAGVEG